MKKHILFLFNILNATVLLFAVFMVFGCSGSENQYILNDNINKSEEELAQIILNKVDNQYLFFNDVKACGERVFVTPGDLKIKYRQHLRDDIKSYGQYNDNIREVYREIIPVFVIDSAYYYLQKGILYNYSEYKIMLLDKSSQNK
jgi:hypothetical protein